MCANCLATHQLYSEHFTTFFNKKYSRGRPISNLLRGSRTDTWTILDYVIVNFWSRADHKRALSVASVIAKKLRSGIEFCYVRA